MGCRDCNIPEKQGTIPRRPLIPSHASPLDVTRSRTHISPLQASNTKARPSFCQDGTWYAIIILAGASSPPWPPPQALPRRGAFALLSIAQTAGLHNSDAGHAGRQRSWRQCRKRTCGKRRKGQGRWITYSERPQHVVCPFSLCVLQCPRWARAPFDSDLVWASTISEASTAGGRTEVWPPAFCCLGLVTWCYSRLVPSGMMALFRDAASSSCSGITIASFRLAAASLPPNRR